MFTFGRTISGHWGFGLLYALLASGLPAAAEAVEGATPTLDPGPTRLTGILSGGANGGETTIVQPSVISLAAAKELGDASKQLRVWLEEILAAAGTVTIASLAILAYRRKRRERAQKLQNLYQLTEMPASLSDRQTPRNLPSNPYGGASTPELLNRQIENAAEASLEFGRVFGLIYFDLGERPKGDFSVEARDWDAEQLELRDRLQNALRRTDHVTSISDHEIVACIALLPGKSELIGIAERLRKIGRNAPRFAEAFIPQAGLAIYPACGYRGQELIDYARSDFQAHKTVEILEPTPAPKALTFSAVAFPKP